jgi:hypothetical protein
MGQISILVIRTISAADPGVSAIHPDCGAYLRFTITQAVTCAADKAHFSLTLSTK